MKAVQSEHRKRATTGSGTRRTLGPSKSDPDHHAIPQIAALHVPCAWPCLLPNHRNRLNARVSLSYINPWLSGLQAPSLHPQTKHSNPQRSSSVPRKQEPTMISAKRIAQLAKKWQRMVAPGRKRLTMTTATKEAEGSCSTSVAGKGHFVVYAADGARFEVPLAYLGTAVFGELLRMSQEEFGFAGDDGRITLPCDAAVMEYAMCLLRRNASAEIEKAFLSSMAMPCHYASCAAPSLGVSQHVAVCSS